MDKKIKTAKEHQEDDALNRALLWVAGAVIMEGLLMLVNRYYLEFYTDEVNIALAISTMLRVGMVLFLIVAAAGLVWYLKAKRSGKTALLPAVVALGGLALWLFCIILWVFSGSGATLLFVLVPAVAVLALVYYLYQRECFLAVAVTALGLFGMWLLRKGYAGPYAVMIRICLILLAVAVLVVLVLLFRLQGRKGMLNFRDKDIRILSKKTNYPLLMATCVIVAVAVVAALVGITLSYYLIFLLIAWAFILVVYYTVQML